MSVETTNRPWELRGPTQIYGNLQRDQNSTGDRVAVTTTATDAALIVEAVNAYDKQSATRPSKPVSAPAVGGDGVAELQERVRAWALECFGDEIACDMLERMDRFTEEALELVQSLGYTPDRAHALADYVFGRPAGEPTQEVGGTMTTLAAMCNVAGIDITQSFITEVDRITQPDIVLKIRAKQAAKPTGSALPVPPTPTGGDREVEAVAWLCNDLIIPGESVITDKWLAERRHEQRYEGEPTWRVEPLVPASALAAERAAHEQTKQERDEAQALVGRNAVAVAYANNDRIDLASCRSELEKADADFATQRATIAKLEDALRVAVEDAARRAASTWCGEKDRETFPEDIAYFMYNWRFFPGLRAYVEREIGRAALAAQTEAEVGTALPVQDGGADHA